jgi:hypothetical protein
MSVVKLTSRLDYQGCGFDKKSQTRGPWLLTLALVSSPVGNRWLEEYALDQPHFIQQSGASLPFIRVNEPCARLVKQIEKPSGRCTEAMTSFTESRERQCAYHLQVQSRLLNDFIT